ncbi:MAG TPA: hypothetical protein VEY10_08905 [Flavisolibacter sp.]|jgi:hypothetical protein|nr:hypothetical protein [Flavisolibacter sp.]
MKKAVFFCLVAAAFAACSKDKFQTIPQVTITSFGPDVVFKGQRFELLADITDKEGDLQDTFYLVQKRYTGDNLLTSDTAKYSLANLGFPAKDKIELRLTFAYGEQINGTLLQNQESADRGLIYGLIIRDKAKNKSVYVESKKILLKKV